MDVQFNKVILYKGGYWCLGYGYTVDVIQNGNFKEYTFERKEDAVNFAYEKKEEIGGLLKIVDL